MAKRFIQYFEDSFKENWDLPAMTNYETKQTFKYSDVAREIAKLHILFDNLKIKKDDKIAILGLNSPEWAMVFIATITYGAVAVPILQNNSKENIEYILNHSDTCYLFADETLWNKISDISCSYLKGVLSLLDFQCLYQSEGCYVQHAVNDMLGNFLNRYPQFDSSAIHFPYKEDDDLMVLVYTSGTTDYGKGVMLCGRNFLLQTKFVVDYQIGKRGANSLSYIPLANTGGYVSLFLLIQGMHLTIFPKFPSPNELVMVSQQLSPHYMVLVPYFLEVIIEKVGLSSYSDSSLSNEEAVHIRQNLIAMLGGCIETVFVGGASIDEKIEKVLAAIDFPYMVGYGMTETASQISVNTSRRFQSVGKPSDGVLIEIDSDDPINIPGEILIKGSNIMMGYYKNDEATKNAFTEDGFFRSGDLGVFDKDGYLYIKGRCKTMILTSNGQNIYPEAIEMKLNKSPYIEESVVVQDDKRLVAWVYPSSEVMKKSFSEEEMTHYMNKVRMDINSHLASYEFISEFKIHLTPFEKSYKKSIKRYLYELK